MHGTVLVVDDDADAAAMVGAALRHAGHEVALETDPVRAIEVAMRDDIEVVVTDLQMTGLDGNALCAKLSAARPDLPVVLVTGHASVNAAIGAMHAGAFDFLVKPAEPAALVRVVERAIEHHRSAVRSRDASSMPAASALVSAAELERRYVAHVLEVVKGNKSRAARILGFDRRTLYRKLERTAAVTTAANGLSHEA